MSAAMRSMAWMLSPMSRLLRGVGRGRLGVAQDAPVHVGSKVFASDDAACRALNGGAMVGGDLSIAGLPLVDRGARYAQKARELCLGTNDGRSPVNGMG